MRAIPPMLGVALTAMLVAGVWAALGPGEADDPARQTRDDNSRRDHRALAADAASTSWFELERQQKELGRWSRGSIASMTPREIHFRIPGVNGKPPRVLNLTIDEQTVVMVVSRGELPRNIRVRGGLPIRYERGTLKQLTSGTNAAVSWDEYDRTLVIEIGLYVTTDKVVAASPPFAMPTRPPPTTAPTTQPGTSATKPAA